MKKRIKQKIFNALEVIKEHKTAAVGTVAVAAPMAMSVAASAAGEGGTVTVPSIADNVTSAMLNQVLTQMTDLIPILLPVVVACIAFRKGISFLKGMLHGA